MSKNLLGCFLLFQLRILFMIDLQAQSKLLSVYPGSLHLRINNGDSSYMRITKFGLNYSDSNISIEFKNTDSTFLYEIIPKRKVELEECYISGSIHPELYGDIFCNGFQSWSESREYGQNEKMKPISSILKPYAKYYGDYTYYNYSSKKGVLHSWTYTYLERNDNQIELIASLDEDPGFTLIRFYHPYNSFRIERDCAGKIIETNAYQLFHIYHQIGHQDTMFNQWAKLYKPDLNWSNPGTATGWTSWYNYYQHINEKIILHNLSNYDSLPIDIFQIDDGYQHSIGNWTSTNKKFPTGLKALADSIHGKNIKAGIWIAPFVCQKNSPLVKLHPDWIIKDEKGRFIKAGYNPGWGGWYYAFDIYNEGYRSYMKNQIDTLIHVFGYDMIKADFLFAACIQYRNGKTRGEIMSDAMDWLRTLTEGKLLLGCGVPLASAFKRVDYCRIGNDIHTAWEYKLLNSLHAKERPSTISSLTNTLFRHPLNHRFFVNDPDVFILRKEKNTMSSDQRYTNFLMNQMLGGLLFTSDDISLYDTLTMNIYKKHLEKPVIKVQKVDINNSNRAILIQHTTNECPMFTMINLNNKPATFKFPLGIVSLYDYKGNDLNQATGEGMLLELSGIELEKFRSYTAYPQNIKEFTQSQWPCIQYIFPPIE